MSKPLISYIVLTRNSDKTLEKCLYAIKSQTLSKEIIIVDNQSIDNTIPIAEKYQATIINEPSGNMAIARNVGMSLCNSQSKCYGFVDSDCVLCKDWDKYMLAHLKKHNVAGAGALQLSLTKTWVSRELDKLTILRANGIATVDSIPTMNALYDMKKIGNTRFNPKMNRVGEDIEFNMQLRAKGYKLLYDSGVTVRHQNPTTLRQLVSKHYHYGFGYKKPYTTHKEYPTLYKLRATWVAVFYVSIILMFFSISTIFYLTLLAPFLVYAIKKPNPKFIIVNGVKQLSTLFGVAMGVVM